MPTLTILQGLPASGKTTWARKQAEQDKNTVIINRDSLRRMRGEYWIPSQEDMITEWEDHCVIEALSLGHNVILDATNLNQERNAQRIQNWHTMSPKPKIFSTIIKTFDTDVDECIRRDANRVDSVGRDVILKMYEKYLKPPPVEYKEASMLPSCIICDIDGTLAKMHDRSPYEWEKVGQDKVNWPVKCLLDAMYIITEHIFLFSGRDESCREETEKWLERHYIKYNTLLMRPEGNNDDDRIIKKYMFEHNVRGKYYCTFVVDDRDKVVRMWREDLGLTCLQVDYGNF